MYKDVKTVSTNSADLPSGRDLLVDEERQYTEDEKRAAILVQSGLRGSSQRKDYSKLLKSGLSSEAVEFQRAVKSSSRMGDMEEPLMAPTGSPGAIAGYSSLKEGVCSWGLWKSFLRFSIADLPISILANFFLVCFTLTLFYMPMWTSIGVRFIYQDGEGQVDLDQFYKWMLVFAFCTGAVGAITSLLFDVMSRRFAGRVVRAVVGVSGKFNKLIAKEQVEKFVSQDLAAMQSLFFYYLPQGVASLLVVIAGLNFLFIRSHVLGGIALAMVVGSALFLAATDKFIVSIHKTLREAEATQGEFWTYLHTKEKAVAMGELKAIQSVCAKYSMRAALYQIVLGAIFKAATYMSLVVTMHFGIEAIVGNTMRQYEVLFCVFYYAFTLYASLRFNYSIYGAAIAVSRSARLATFLNATQSMARHVKVTSEMRSRKSGLRFRKVRGPISMSIIGFGLFAGAIAAFAAMASTGKSTISCHPAEMVCNICGHASHLISVPQYFDMQSGCVLEQTPDMLANTCLSTVPPTIKKTVDAQRESRRLGLASAECEVYVTMHMGQGGDAGFHIPQPEAALPEGNFCQAKCPAPTACHAEGVCQASNGECTYPILADLTNCTESGVAGQCRAGTCVPMSLKGQEKRRLADKEAEQLFHERRRLKQLGAVHNEKIALTASESASFKAMQARKAEQVEQFAEVSRRRLQEAAATPGAVEATMCPLPGQTNTEDCKGANIKGCMDEAGLNYNPQATLATECCYPPNRYVKVDMSESIFRENFWTMSVDGAVTGIGLPLVGSDEACVPEDTCVQVKAFDDACDGMVVGGGGISVSSRVLVDGKVHTVVDAEADFQCSKKTQFGVCPVEGCTDKAAVNYNHIATIDDGSCDYLACNAGERAVVVNMKYDADVLSGKDSTTWKITDADGSTLVDSEEFSSIYAGETSTNYYCFPETKCLYYLIKDGAGNGLTADGHYEVKYGKVGDLHVVAAGNEFDWIKAHFVGGPATCAKQ
jgi:hypothetical protein